MEINIWPRHSVFAIHHPKYQHFPLMIFILADKIECKPNALYDPFSQCETPFALHSPVGLTMPAGVMSTEEFFYTSRCSSKT